jgi:hypothetical protein
MQFTNQRKVMQKIWVVVAGLVAVYGAISIFTRAEQALAAWSGAAPSQPAVIEAAVPAVLNYQVTLRDAEGKPISGIHKLTFRIYGDVTAPTKVDPFVKTARGRKIKSVPPFVKEAVAVGLA